MKGMVLTEFLEMVEDTHGADRADRLVESIESASGGAYTAVGTYDIAELVALVTELSRAAAETPQEILGAFGRHLFARFVEMFPDLGCTRPPRCSRASRATSIRRS